MRNVAYIAIGLILIVFGFLLMTKLHRGKGITKSVLASFLELLFDTVIGLLTKDLVPGVGAIAFLMVFVGLIMMIVNIVQLIGGFVG